MDDFEMAKENFMKCVAGDQQDYSSLYNVVYCFEYLEDYEGAIFYLNEYLEYHPYCQVAWHQLGKQYFTEQMFMGAACIYKTPAIIFPGSLKLTQYIVFIAYSGFSACVPTPSHAKKL